MSEWPESNAPVLGICGWSGSGKTTLIEQLLPALAARGLAVAVVKHDAHRLDVDREGKDTHRFYAAGAAAVCAFDSEQSFHRSRGTADPDALIQSAAAAADLVLVEGLKESAGPKLWLEHPGGRNEPSTAQNVVATLKPGPDRKAEALRIVTDWLNATWQDRPVCCGILVGGASRRMGRPKALLQAGEGTLAEALYDETRAVCSNVVFLGNRPELSELARLAPLLPDAPDAQGPLAGILSAMRWNNRAAWVFLACDMPGMKADFIDWLVAQRRPGAWAIAPQLPGSKHPEPLATLYEPQMQTTFERLAASGHTAVRDILRFSNTKTLELPAELQPRLVNVNSPEDCNRWNERSTDTARRLYWASRSTRSR